MKRTVKINFKGFWNNLDPEDNFFTNILREKYDVEISENPDYLFCSVFSYEFLKYENVIRIFFSGEYQTPDFNLFDYGMSFDYISFDDRYCRLPLYLLYGQDLLEMAQKRGGMIDNPVYKDRFCSFVYSNAKASPLRERFFKELSKYKQVNSGGRYLNNVGGPVEDKVAFESEHRFSMTFENSSYPGYMSEKLFQAFAAGTVPIYWGDTEADQVINPNAYVNVSRYHSLSDVVDHIRELETDEQKYLEMLHEPVFVEKYRIADHIEEIKRFLFHIFEQSFDESFRRNRSFRGRNYELFFRRYGRFDDLIHNRHQ